MKYVARWIALVFGLFGGSILISVLTIDSGTGEVPNENLIRPRRHVITTPSIPTERPPERKVEQEIMNVEPRVNFKQLAENVYTAFSIADYREGNMGRPSVRIFVLLHKKDTLIKCRFKNEITVEASVYEFSENHAKPLGSYYASCPIPDQLLEEKVEEYEISTGTNDNWHSMKIDHIIGNELTTKYSYRHNYSICVPFLFGNAYSAERLIEFFELNKLIGASHVFIYMDKNELSSDVKKVVDFYERARMLTVVEFVLPFDDEQIWYHAQLVAVTECLNRNTGLSKYTGFHDLDEFVVPQQENRIVETLDRIFTSRVGSRRVVTQYMNSGGSPPITLAKSTKTDLLDDRYTKCVLRPEMVFEQGIHHTSRVIQDNYESPHELGSNLRVFHYKPKPGQSEDRTIETKYGQSLRISYDAAVKAIFV